MNESHSCLSVSVDTVKDCVSPNQFIIEIKMCFTNEHLVQAVNDIMDVFLCKHITKFSFILHTFYTPI